MANGMIPPNKAKIKIALNYLEEEGFAGWAKQKIKERLFELDLVAVDPDMIASEVITARADAIQIDWFLRSEEHTSELQSLMRISYAVFCLKKKNKQVQEKERSRVHDNTQNNTANTHTHNV